MILPASLLRYKQSTSLLDKKLYLSVDVLHRDTKLFRKAGLTEEAGTSPVDKLFMRAYFIVCQFLGTLDTRTHYRSITFARYTAQSKGSSPFMMAAFLTVVFSPVHTSVSSRVFPVLNGSPTSSRFTLA